MISALAIISVFLPLLKAILAAATQNNLPAEIIDAISSAINALSSVHGSDVTREQLESLRVEPKW